MDEMYNGYDDVDINANETELEDNVTNGLSLIHI